MSLLRLLTAGKSLVGIGNPERRFRMSHPGAMPKFGNKTSFRAEAPQASVGPTPEALAAASASQTAVVVDENLAGANGCESEQVKDPESAETGPREVPPDGPPGMAQKGIGAWVGNWGARLISLAPRKRARPVNASAVRRNEAPLQGELSLDNIRVMRNDLSETDLEVVAGKRPETATAVEVAREARLEKAQPPSAEPAPGKRRGAASGETRRGRVAMMFWAEKT
jgi:hypothetical protein